MPGSFLNADQGTPHSHCKDTRMESRGHLSRGLEKAERTGGFQQPLWRGPGKTAEGSLWGSQRGWQGHWGQRVVRDESSLRGEM